MQQKLNCFVSHGGPSYIYPPSCRIYILISVITPRTLHSDQSIVSCLTAAFSAHRSNCLLGEIAWIQALYIDTDHSTHECMCNSYNYTSFGALQFNVQS